MATNEEASKVYDLMCSEWQAANKRAYASRALVTAAFMKCAAGIGTGPTDDLIAETHSLESVADGLRTRMDAFVAKHFAK